MKKMLTILLALATTLSISVSAFAASLTEQQAVGTALNDAGIAAADAVMLESESEKGSWEIEFVQKSTGTEYEYEISAKDGRILEKSVDFVYKHNQSHKKIGKKTALKKVAEFSGFPLKTVKSGSIRYKYSHKEGSYKIKFISGEYRYEYKVLAVNGKIIEWEMNALRK